MLPIHLEGSLPLGSDLLSSHRLTSPLFVYPSQGFTACHHRKSQKLHAQFVPKSSILMNEIMKFFASLLWPYPVKWYFVFISTCLFCGWKPLMKPIRKRLYICWQRNFVRKWYFLSPSSFSHHFGSEVLILRIAELLIRMFSMIWSKSDIQLLFDPWNFTGLSGPEANYPIFFQTSHLQWFLRGM